jgi:hypothetical protein
VRAETGGLVDGGETEGRRVSRCVFVAGGEADDEPGVDDVFGGSFARILCVPLKLLFSIVSQLVINRARGWCTCDNRMRGAREAEAKDPRGARALDTPRSIDGCSFTACDDGLALPRKSIASESNTGTTLSFPCALGIFRRIPEYF